jgi:hypothetical protein
MQRAVSMQQERVMADLPPPIGAPDGVTDQLAEIDRAAKARQRSRANALRVGSVAVALSFVFLLRHDLVYATQPLEPVSLGGPLEFDLGQEHSQRYAKIRAVPGDQTATFDYFGHHYRTFGMMASNVIVQQDLADLGPADQPTKGQVFEAVGRLWRDDDAPELGNLYKQFEARGIVFRQDEHLYVLRTGETPRKGIALPLQLLGILAFVVFNWIAARRVEKPVPDFE